MGIADVFPFLKTLDPKELLHFPSSTDAKPEAEDRHVSAETTHSQPWHTPRADHQHLDTIAPRHVAQASHLHQPQFLTEASPAPSSINDEPPPDDAGLRGVPVAVPKIEMQPWVKSFISWVSSSTFGVARVDLKRPTPPAHAQYAGNIFVVRPTLPPQPARGWRSPGKRPPGIKAQLVGQDSIMVKELDAPQTASGARLKITRHVALGVPEEGGTPLFDFGIGLNFDMDMQRLAPVARIKIKDFAAIKAYPRPLLKVGGEWRILDTSLALKLHYEVPLVHLRHPFEPPARLLLRLDHVVNSGFKLNPSGIEFDQTVMQLGDSTSVRAAGGVQFPRQLPIQGDVQDAFKIQLHRLGLKTFW